MNPHKNTHTWRMLFLCFYVEKANGVFTVKWQVFLHKNIGKSPTPR